MSYVDWIRARVGRRKIFLVFASVALRDEYGRILLQRRTDFDVWGLPGGVLELDEEIEACARRELREETGLTAGPLSLVGVYTDPRFDVTYPNGDQVQQFTICFGGRVNGGRMQPDGLETSAQRFVALSEMDGLRIPSWYRAMLADAQNGAAYHRSPGFLPPFAAAQTEDQIAAIRPFIGHERLIAVGTKVAVVRDNGCVLALRRADTGTWALPAGYCDLGENVAQTAVREVCEETGYEVEPQRIVGVYSAPRFHYTFANGDRVKNVGVVFRARPVGGQAQPAPGETAELAWMTPTELLQAADDWYRPLAAQIVAHLHTGYFVM